MNANLRIFIDVSRWVSAFLVVLSHGKNLILVDFRYVENKTYFFKAFYFISGLGHEAVVVFFVISGFLVGGVTLERWLTNGVNFGKYASARISRIYTVLIPALIVGISIDLIGMHWFNAGELYTNSALYPTITLNRLMSSTMNVPTFFGNIFMLQGILTDNLGSNGALWSLANEWWYYCIFGFLAASYTSNGYKRIIYAVLAIIIMMYLPAKIMLWSLVWLLGIVAHIWIRSKMSHPPAFIGITILIVAIAVSRLSHSVPSNESITITLLRDIFLGIAYTIAMVSVFSIKTTIPLSFYHEKLADFSYTTYLFHLPAMVFIVSVGFQIFNLRFQLQPGLFSLSYLLILIVFLYLFCYGCYFLAERHTGLIKRKIDRPFKV